MTARTDLAQAKASLKRAQQARKLHAKACRKCAKLRHLRYIHCDEGWALLTNERNAREKIAYLTQLPGPEQPMLF